MASGVQPYFFYWMDDDVIITGFEIYKYRLPLNIPIPLASKLLLFREGLIIQIFNEKGVFGLGDIAPLPGLSRETLAQAQKQILTLKRFWASVRQSFSSIFQDSL